MNNNFIEPSFDDSPSLEEIYEKLKEFKKLDVLAKYSYHGITLSNYDMKILNDRISIIKELMKEKKCTDFQMLQKECKQRFNLIDLKELAPDIVKYYVERGKEEIIPEKHKYWEEFCYNLYYDNKKNLKVIKVAVKFLVAIKKGNQRNFIDEAMDMISVDEDYILGYIDTLLTNIYNSENLYNNLIYKNRVKSDINDSQEEIKHLIKKFDDRQKENH